MPNFLYKAKYADVYILKRHSYFTEYPNLQVTKDFKSFSSLTKLSPNKKYNRLTSEFTHWTTFDGRPGTGILYKPENFDPGQKYPVIFYFYEQLSAGLNKFIEPELSSGPMNIPFLLVRDMQFFPRIFITKQEG